MNRAKGVVHWFVLPFGSLRVLAAIFFIFLLGWTADMASTYWFLNKYDFDFSRESSPFNRMLFTSFGFFGGEAAHLFLSLIFVFPLCASLFYLLRPSGNLALAKILPAAVLISYGIGGLIVAIYNVRLSDLFHSALPDNLIENYLYVFLILMYTLIFIAAAFFLYILRYGKKSLQADDLS